MLLLRTTILSSLQTNISLWFFTYASFHLFLTAFKSQLKPYKLNPLDSDTKLMMKEIRRSFTSVLCCCIWDVFLRFMVIGTYDSNVANVVTIKMIGETLISKDFLLKLIPSLIWADAHFYVVHRMLHQIKWLYINVHKVHHESINTNVWSGLSFHPLEGFLYFSTLSLVFFLRPTFTEFTIFRSLVILAPIGGHYGYDFWQGKYLAKIDHYVHHVKFNYNFGSGLFPEHFVWDRLLNTRFRGTLDKKIK